MTNEIEILNAIAADVSNIRVSILVIQALVGFLCGIGLVYIFRK
jgi:hypothetical protein